MPGKDVDEEFVGIDGIVATGVFGVAVAPTSAGAALDVSWTDHGLTTAAGVTRSEPVSATARRAWQNNAKLRTLVTEAAVRFVFVLVQTSEANVELFHGTSMVGGKLTINPGADRDPIAFDFDTIDGDNVIREYAPRAKVVEVGDQVAVAGDTFGWPITIEAEYDEGIGGYTQRFFSEFEAAVVPTITTALPTAQAVGEVVVLVGTGFTGASAITVGGVAAPTYDIISDTNIYVTLPAGAGGSAPIIVTNAAGASIAKAYTRA